jgi:hypothetical protein
MILATLLLLLLPSAATVHGTVRVEGSQEPIARATVQIPALRRGVLADERGYFVLAGVPAGRWTVRVSALGYRSVEREIEVPASGAVRLDVELAAAPVELAGVEVRARARSEMTAETAAGPPPARITAPALRAVPALAEVDVLRVVQTLPAVAAASDFSSALYVRGGSPDQTLITLDGVPLFNPYHLGGLFSAIDADAVSEVDVLAGATPASAGDRLSGAVAIRTREGGRDRVRASGALGLISSRASADGPLPGGRGSSLVSARRTYLDLFTGAAYALGATNTTLPYAFTDAYLKATHGVGSTGQLSAAVYLDAEHFRIPERMQRAIDTDAQFGWGSRVASLGYRQLFGPALVGELRLAVSGFYGDFAARERRYTMTDVAPLDDELTPYLDARSRISDALVGAYLTWYARRHEVRFGAQLDRYRFEHDVAVHEAGLRDYVPEFRSASRPATLAAYVEDSWTPREELSVRGGVRVLHAGEWGTAWMPRLGARWALTPVLALSVGAGRYAQLMHSLRDEESLAASLLAYDFLGATAPAAGMMTAEDVVLGAEWSAGATSVRVDAYAKRFDRLPLPPLPDNLVETPVLVPEGHRLGTGRAHGVELLARHARGRADFTLAYALAFASREAEGERFAPRFERRHTLDALAALPLGAQGQWSARLVLATGQPYTPVVGSVPFDPYDPRLGGFAPAWEMTALLGEHNSARLPGYLRLDVGARRSFERRWFGRETTVTPYLQVLNALNTKNVLTALPTNTFEGRPVLDYAPQLPFFPTLGLEWKF